MLKIVLFLVAVAVAILSIFLGKKKKAKAAGVLFAVVIFIAVDCVAIVPTGYSGVRSTFGQVSEQSVPTGANLKFPFIQNISLVNNKQRDVRLAENQVWGETKEQVQLYAKDAVVSYRLLPEKSAYVYINFANTDQLVDESLFDSAFKRTTVTLESSTATNRAVVEPAVQQTLQQLVDEKYGENTIVISQVVINQMDFEESYNNAIAERNTAEQKRQQQAIDNKTAKEKAEADAEVARVTAQGEADAEKIRAQGKADANAILSNSITDKTLQQNMLDKWNGVLPNVMTSGDGVMSVFDITASTTQPAATN